MLKALIMYAGLEVPKVHDVGIDTVWYF